MNQGILWAGFLGAWLLVVGPLYQGALELGEEDVDRDELQSTKTKVDRPEPPSPWWWLLPPVMYVLRRRQGKAFRDSVVASLSPEQREQFTRFMNKATGWFTVAAGATLLAADQTWRLTEQYHWPAWVFWLIMVVTLGASVLNTAARMIRNAQESKAGAGSAGDAAAEGDVAAG
jgi:hypothetical protein